MKPPLRVRESMSRPVTVVRDDDTLGVAALAMFAGECHHVPVLDSSAALVGVVSRHDLPEPDGGRRRVRDVMHAPVVTVGRDTLASHAAALLVDNDIGCVVVLGKQNVPVGILTASDLLLAAEPAFDGKRARPRVRP